jgi:parvulin-like peptidyl-prolyl isomerase
MEKKNIPKKDSNGKKDSLLRKEALRVIRTKQIINLALVLLIVLIIGAGTFMFYLNTTSEGINNKMPGVNVFINNIISINDRIFQKKIAPAAVVNGEEITMKELGDRYNLLPSDYKTLISELDVLSQMIDEKILLQHAGKLNITISKEDVDARIKTLLDDNQITETEFEQAIKAKNLTLDAVRDFYSKEILLTKLLNQEILSKIDISEKDIKKYYDNNPILFKIPASVNVSHILICHNESMRCVSNLTKEEALAMAENVRKMLNKTNFAELALEYSDEPAAKITNGNLGWVSTESPFDKTFMNATFALEPGQFSEPVETVFGYHLIKVFEKREESMLNLTLVHDQINKTLALEEEKTKFGVYVSELRNQSTVINYLEKKN